MPCCDFFERNEAKPCSPFNMAPRPLAKPPVSLSLGDEVPHIFIRESHQRPRKNLDQRWKTTFSTASVNSTLYQRVLRASASPPISRPYFNLIDPAGRANNGLMHCNIRARLHGRYHSRISSARGYCPRAGT